MSHNKHLPMLGGYSSSIASSQSLNCLENGITNKQKRKPPGTPDPDAEVIYLSPQTLMESDHYVCEICNQGFQREQNLQMHRRRHNVPWKLLKRDAMDNQVRKRVYVCPDPTCLHNSPTHALGDLVGIKKHFRRKHSNHKQWVCEKCSKGYAVQSDYKSHLKTCGTRGHSCDCGRVFSRVETFIKHQDTCEGRTIHQQPKPPYLLQTCLSPITTNFKMPMQNQTDLISLPHNHHSTTSLYHNFNLQNNSHLKLSLGSVNHGAKSDSNSSSLKRLEDEGREQLRIAMEEKGFAEEKRRQAKWQIELAKQDFSNAKRIREQALVELNKAQIMKECAMKKINSNLLQITCTACKREFQEIRE